jgi:lysozyme
MPGTKSMLIFDEGIRTDVYKCPAGFLSVGIGHNLITNPALKILGKSLKLGDRITHDQIQQLYDYDLMIVKNGLKGEIPSYELLLDKYKTILINMSFNMGVHGVLKFQDMIHAMKLNNEDNVVVAIRDSGYYHQLPKRAERMIKLAKGEAVHEYD